DQRRRSVIRNRSALAMPAEQRGRIGVWITSHDATPINVRRRRSDATEFSAVTVRKYRRRGYWSRLHVGQAAARALANRIGQFASRSARPERVISSDETLIWKNRHSVAVGRYSESSIAPPISRRPPTIKSVPTLAGRKGIPTNVVSSRCRAVEEVNQRRSPMVISVAISSVTRTEARRPCPSEARQQRPTTIVVRRP